MMENDWNVNREALRRGAAMILAGDVGGTKTLLGVFVPLPLRPKRLAIRAFPTSEFADISAMIDVFLKADARGYSIEAACFGVAGPVEGESATLTNVPFRVDAHRVASMLSS